MKEQAPPLELVLLGAAIASPSTLERLLARLDDATLVCMHIGTILAGLKRQDDQALRAWLARQNVPLPTGVRPLDAVAGAVKRNALERQKRRLAQELADAAKLLSYEEYVTFVKQKLADGSKNANAAPAHAGNSRST